MADDKSLKIGMKFDDKGGKAAAQSLGDLKKKTDDFNKSVGGLNKSLKSLNVELKLKVKDFGALTKEIEKTGKTFQSQIKDVTAYTKALETLNKALGANTKSASRGRGRGATVSNGVATPTAATTAGGLGGNAGGAPSNPIFVTVVGGNGQSNGSGQMLPLPGGGYQNANSRRRNAWINGGTNVAAGNWPGGIPHGSFNIPRHQDVKVGANVGKEIANYFQEMKLLPAQNQAGVRGFRGNMMKNMMGGDFSDALALQIMNSEGKSAYDKFGGTKLLGASSFLGGVSGTAAGVPGGLPGVIGGGLKGMADASKMSMFGGKDKIEADTMGAGIGAVKEMNPEKMMIFQNLLQNSQAGLAASRRLGGMGVGSAWAGVGAGMGPQESWQYLTQGANQFGAQVMMGGEGGSKQVATGKTIQDPKKIAQWQSYQENMDPAAWASMYGQAVSNGSMNTPEMKAQRTRSRGLGQIGLDFQEKGFDRNVMTGLMGNVQAMGSGDNGSRMAATEKMFMKAVGEGVSKGITDIQTLEALSTAIAGAAVSRTGGVMDGTGQLGNMLSMGMDGKNSNPIAIAQRMEGLTAFGAAQQSNPFLKNRSMARAVSVLGNDAEMGDVMGLSGASPQDLLSSGGALGAAGITNKQRLSMLRGTLEDNLRMGSSSSKKMRGMVDKYGGYDAALQHEDFRKQAAFTLQGSVGGYGDYQSTNRALEAFSMMKPDDGTEAGAGKSLKDLKNASGGFGASASAQAKVQAQALSDAFTPEASELFSKTLASIGDMYKTASSWKGNGLDDARLTIQALEKLIDKIAKLSPVQVEKVTDAIVKPTGN